MGEARRPDTTFWVEPGGVDGSRLTLDPDESRHLLRVHRATPGTPFEAVDGDGTTYHCVLETAHDGVAIGRVDRTDRDRGELPVSIHLLVGLPDPAATESVVEHAVPLGASVLDFVACERSGRPAMGPSRIERLARLARSGVKQSRRSRLPAIRSSDSLADGITRAPEGERLAADPAGTVFSGERSQSAQADAVLAVGPPGGFTEAELRLLQEAGFRLISLGPSRLTSETAAIALLALFRNSLPHK